MTAACVLCARDFEYPENIDPEFCPDCDALWHSKDRSRELFAAFLGKDLVNGEKVFLSDSSRAQGLSIIGLPGTGKTSLILRLVMHDIERNRGVCVLDPHGDLVNDVLNSLPQDRQNDLVLLDPADFERPFGLNLFSPGVRRDAIMKARVAGGFVDLFRKLWGNEGSEGTSWGPRVEQTLRNIAYVFLENSDYTLAEVPTFLTNSVFRSRLLENVNNIQVKSFWTRFDSLSPREQELRTDSTLNKLDRFLTQEVVENIVGQSDSTVDLRLLMDSRKIVLVPLALGELGSDVCSLIGSTLVLQTLLAALSRLDQPVEERTPFCLYADEFQRFATPAFEELLAEARKFGIRTTIAHQQLAQLESGSREINTPTSNRVVFRVSGADSIELAKEFDSKPEDPAIVGQRAQTTVVYDAIQQILKRGHPDSRVVAIIGKYFDELERLDDDVRSLSRPYSTDPEDQRAYALYVQRLYDRQEQMSTLVKDVNEWLRAKMSNEKASNDLTIIFKLLRTFRGDVPNPSNVTYNNKAVREAVSRIWYGSPHTSLPELLAQYETLIDARSSELGHIHVQDLVSLLNDLRHLTGTLEQMPIATETGQYEPIYETRSYADGQAQVANELRSLPNYVARCRLIDSQGAVPGSSPQGRPREHMVALERPSPPSTDEDSLIELRLRSRNTYGRDRSEVRQSLADRMVILDESHSTTRPNPTVRAARLQDPLGTDGSTSL